MNQRRIRNFYFALLQTRLGLVLSVLFRSWNYFRFETPKFFKRLAAIWRSHEFVNFTYHLSGSARNLLPYFIAQTIRCSVTDAENAIRELETDEALAEYHRVGILNSYRRWGSDAEFKPGRILLHYAIVRLTKPRLVLEAGVDKGSGAIIINKALQRNRDEGYQADYLGVEYRPDRPAFLIEKFPDKVGKIVYSPWADEFEKLQHGAVDFLFYDAVATEEQLEKFVTFSDRLSEHAIIISAWSFKYLYDVADRIGRDAQVFAASARDHWFDGSDLCVISKRPSEPLMFQPKVK